MYLSVSASFSVNLCLILFLTLFFPSSYFIIFSLFPLPLFSYPVPFSSMVISILHPLTFSFISFSSHPPSHLLILFYSTPSSIFYHLYKLFSFHFFLFSFLTSLPSSPLLLFPFFNYRCLLCRPLSLPLLSLYFHVFSPTL